MKKFAFALESDEVVEEVTPEMPAEEIMESTAEVEEMHEDVMEDVGEVGELHEAMSEGVEGSDALVEVSDVMAEKVEDGEGMSEDAAKIAEVAIESIRVRLGLSKSMAKIPSLESFKSARSRVEATRIALESVSDTAKKIWAKIVEICKNIWTKISAFLTGLIKNYTLLEKHLVMLKGRAGEVKGEMAAEVLAKPALAKFFTMGTEANLATAEKCLAKVDTFSAGADKVMEKVTSSIAVANINGTSFNEGLESVFKAVGFEGWVPGNEEVMFKSEDGKLMLEFVAGKTPAKEIKALSKEEITSLLDKAIASAKKGADLKKVSAEAEKAVKAIIAKAEQMMKNLKDEPEGVKELPKVLNSGAAIVNKVAAKMPALHFSTVKFAGDYAAASIMNFKMKKEEKKA